MLAWQGCGRQVSAKLTSKNVGVQEEVEQQAGVIGRLEAALERQLEDLEATQAQLEATQSSLIDLEDHLTTLEEEDDDEDDEVDSARSPSSPSSLQPGSDADPSAAAAPSQASSQASPDLAHKAGQLQNNTPNESTSGRDDAVQSAFVDTIGSLFPPPQNISDEDAAEAELALHEDPFELFEQGKAVVQARAEQQPVAEDRQLQQPDLADGGQAGTTRAGSLVNSSGGTWSHYTCWAMCCMKRHDSLNTYAGCSMP